jgi:hypothetical protein
MDRVQARGRVRCSSEYMELLAGERAPPWTRCTTCVDSGVVPTAGALPLCYPVASPSHAPSFSREVGTSEGRNDCHRRSAPSPRRKAPPLSSAEEREGACSR